MKTLVLLLQIMFLSACGTKDPSVQVGAGPISTDEAALVEQKKVEPLAEYTGYWQQIGGIEENVIEIVSESAYPDEGFLTRVKGLNLKPDFGYPSLAYSDNDNPKLEMHDGKAEALMMRTISSHRQVLQFLFNFSDSNRLEITASAPGKKVTWNYTRLPEGHDTEVRYRKIHTARASAILDAELGERLTDFCSSGQSLYLTLAIDYHHVKCFKKLFETGHFGVNHAPILHYAVKNMDLQIVEYLLSKGADVNLIDEHGKMPLDLLFDAGERKVYMGEHGAVRTTIHGENVLMSLLGAGADVKDGYILAQIARHTDSVDLLNAILDRKPDLTNGFLIMFAAFFNQYDRHWGVGRTELLKRLLSMLHQEQIAKLSDDSLVRIWALKYLDIESLNVMKDAGFKFHDSFHDPRYAVEEEISRSEQWLKTQKDIAWRDRKKTESEISNLRRNLQWAEASPR